MLRILKFIGAFLGTFLVIFFIVFGFNMQALFTLFENSEEIQEGQEWVAKTQSLKGLTEYIAAQPERVSVASLALNNPDSSILYNEHAPRSMGRLSNIFLLIEYARQVESGMLDPREEVALSSVGRHQLPYMDASSHDNAVATMRDRGRVSEQNTMALEDVVQMSIAFNDLAASDYLYQHFGSESIEELLNLLGIEQTELPLPFNGLYITLNPNLQQGGYQVRMDSLSNLSRTGFDSLVINNSQQFVSDEKFRTRIVSRFREDQGMGVSFTELRDILKFFPKTTALEMATLMKGIQEGSLLSEEVATRIRDIMDWPMRIGRLQNDLESYGAIYDSRMGLVNGIDYGASTYSEEPFAQAVLFDELQVAFWFHMSSNLIHQDFQQRLIWDPALRVATVREIQNNKYP